MRGDSYVLMSRVTPAMLHEWRSGEVAKAVFCQLIEKYLERVAPFRDHRSIFDSHRETGGKDIRRDAHYDFNIASVTRETQSDIRNPFVSHPRQVLPRARRRRQ